MPTIQAVAQINPASAPASNVALPDGRWLLINPPNCPDGELKTDSRYSLNWRSGESQW